MNTREQSSTFHKVLLFVFSSLTICVGVFLLTLLPDRRGTQAGIGHMPAACTSIWTPDDIPSPDKLGFDDLGDQVEITDHYLGTYGVQFEASAPARAWTQTDTRSVSSPNVAYNHISSGSNRNEPFYMIFSILRTEVGFYIGNAGTDSPTASLLGYDSEGNLICEAYADVQDDLTTFIGIHDPEGRISWVTLDYGDTEQAEMIDDLYLAPAYTPPPPTCPVAFTGYPASVNQRSPINVSWAVTNNSYSETQTFLAYDTVSHPVNGRYPRTQAPNPNKGMGLFSTAIPTPTSGQMYIRIGLRYQDPLIGLMTTCQSADEIMVDIIYVQPPPPPAPGAVEGTVTVYKSGSAIADATVNLCRLGICTSQVTDQKGYFIFPNQPPGNYKIDTSVMGYKPYAANITVSSNQSTWVDIILRKIPSEPPLPPTGSIAGHVLDIRNNQPLPGASVSLRPMQTNLEYQISTTDANGVFNFANIPAGDYVIWASLRCYAVWFRFYTVTAGGTASGDILLTPRCAPPIEDSSAPFDYTIAHMMSVQATQNWVNQIPLVAGKETSLRVFVDTGGDTTAYGPLVFGTLTEPNCIAGYLGTSVAYPHLNVAWTNSSMSRSATIQDFRSTLNFELPLACTTAGTRTFTVNITTRLDRPERDIHNNTATITSTFYNRRPLMVHVVRAALRSSAWCPGPAPRPEPPHSEIDPSFFYMKKIYPTVVYTIDEGREDYCASPRPDNDLAGYWWINLWLGIRFGNFAQTAVPGFALPWPVHMGYGLIDWHECDGVACIPGQTITGLGWNWVTTGATLNPTTSAHEIGHARGLDHSGNWHGEDDGGGFRGWPYIHGALSVYGPDETWGFDSGTQPSGQDYKPIWSPVYSTMPITATIHDHDFMSYGHPRWISDLTWNDLFNGFIGSGPYGNSQSKTDVKAPATPTRYLMVGGAADDKGVVKIMAMRPFTDTTGTLASQLGLNQTNPISYTLNLVDAYGQVVSTTPIRMQQLAGDKAPNFLATLPYPSGVAAVEIITNTQVIASQLYSNQSPVVQLDNLDTSQPYSGSISLTWSASDLDGDPLTYDVAYSPDGGATWEIRRVLVQDTQVDLDAQYLQGSESALFRVTASDGLNTGYDDIDTPVQIERKKPRAGITSPVEGGVYSSEYSLFLEGSFSDREDLPPYDDIEFVWTSDRDGMIGNGQNTTLVGLTPGRHVITLTVTDLDGMTDSFSVTIFVGEQIFLPLIRKP